MQSRIVDGKYEIVRELSKGGMGAVYEARHLLTGRRVALKLILAETLSGKRPEDALRRFEREARAAGSIESRHVVAVLDTGVDPTTRDRYIVMELLRGEDLRSLLRRVGKLPWEMVLAIARQVCVGLRHAHERGIVHRDIKSANIFLARGDGRVEVKILDFGIAKLRVDPLASHDGHDLTQSGSVLGSPLYMSPEQATGSRELDARSDIWSLGVVMYEALTGATPHANRPLGAVILAICSEPARPLREREPSVPPELAAIVHRALALEPGQRFASAEAMQACLEALLPAGGAIDERALDALPAAAAEPLAETAPSPPADSVAAPQQTTVDAVTYGSGSGRRSTSRRLHTKRALSFGVAAAAVVAGVGLFRARAADAPAGGEESAVSHAVPTAVTRREPAGLARAPRPSAAVSRPPAPDVSGVASAGAAALPPRATVSEARPRERSTQKPKQPTLPAPQPRASVVSAPMAPTATAPPAPRPPDEPAIDRRFE